VLGRRLPMGKYVTRFHDTAWIDRDVSFVDVPNDAFFVDQESCAISEALFLIEDTIVFDDCAFEIAKQWEGNPKLFCKFAVGGNTVYAHAENLSVG